MQYGASEECGDREYEESFRSKFFFKQVRHIHFVLFAVSCSACIDRQERVKKHQITITLETFAIGMGEH